MKFPRDWRVEPSKFGKERGHWRPAKKASEEAERRAAIWQDAVALRVRGAIAEQGTTQRKVADAIGWSEDSLSRMVKGWTWLTVRQVAQLEQELNRDLLSSARAGVER